MQLLIESMAIIIPLTAIMVTLFSWLRQDISAQGDRLDRRIDEQGKEIRTQGDRLNERVDEQGKDVKILIADISALKATLETFFRLRVDPPQPPDNTDPDQVSKVA